MARVEVRDLLLVMKWMRMVVLVVVALVLVLLLLVVRFLGVDVLGAKVAGRAEVVVELQESE
jgi:hypothetical protein